MALEQPMQMNASDGRVICLDAERPRPRLAKRGAQLTESRSLARIEDPRQTRECHFGSWIAEIDEDRLTRFGPEEPRAQSRVCSRRQRRKEFHDAAAGRRRHETV